MCSGRYFSKFEFSSRSGMAMQTMAEKQAKLVDDLVAAILNTPRREGAKPGMTFELQIDKGEEREKCGGASLGENGSLLHAFLNTAYTPLPPPKEIVTQAIASADRQSGFAWSGPDRMSARQHQDWCRDEADKVHMLWMYLRYCFKRSPDGSRDPMLQRLKFLLKQITEGEGFYQGDSSQLPRYEDMDHEDTIERADNAFAAAIVVDDEGEDEGGDLIDLELSQASRKLVPACTLTEPELDDAYMSEPARGREQL